MPFHHPRYARRRMADDGFVTHETCRRHNGIRRRRAALPTTRRATVDAKAWDERYAAHDLVWSVEPNRFVAEIIGPLTPGHAVDLAAGEGRNAIWMVEQGWTVVASDYSPVAVDRMRVARRRPARRRREPPDRARRGRHAAGARRPGGLRPRAALLPPAARRRVAAGAAGRGRGGAAGWPRRRHRPRRPQPRRGLGRAERAGRALRPRGGARPGRRPAGHRPAVGHPGAPGRRPTTASGSRSTPWSCCAARADAA